MKATFRCTAISRHTHSTFVTLTSDAGNEVRLMFTGDAHKAPCAYVIDGEYDIEVKGAGYAHHTAIEAIRRERLLETK